MSSVPAKATVAEILDRRLGSHELDSDDEIGALLRALRDKFNDEISSVILYGSYLRGATDTLLDFYVVVESYEAAFGSKLRALSALVMPPNVYHLAIARGQSNVRAKYAVVSRRQLQRQVSSLHPYFWARFVQPSRLVYARDDVARSQLVETMAKAVDTFVRRVAPLMLGEFSPGEFWNKGFSLTYRAELRAENKARVASIYEHDVGYYTELLGPSLEVQMLQEFPGSYFLSKRGAARAAKWVWVWTIGLGKLLSVARLAKGAVTFNDPIDYILWKIERHSGIRVEATQRQRRYPLLFAWPLAWRLYRLGAFR